MLAPTNDAFSNIDADLLEVVLQPENQELLQEILLYHVLRGFVPSNELQAGPYETLLFGFNVEVTLDPIQFDDSGLVRPDIPACNGIIHIVDEVLIPPEPDFCGDFTFVDRRRLQDGGEDCEPNVLETARLDPELSTIVMLLDSLNDLEDIFDCAGAK